MFNQYLMKLTDITQNITHENFIAIQHLLVNIQDDYTAGALSELEKRTLRNLTILIMDEMRKALIR